MPHRGRRSSSLVRDDRGGPPAWGVRRPQRRSGVVRRHRAAVAGTSSTTRSAAASTAGRWATTTTRLRCASEGEGLEEDLLGLLVEVGARLVEEHDRASGEHDAGQRDAGPLAGGQAGTVLAERRLQAVGEGAYDVGEADAAQRLPHLVVAGRGTADPHVGADGVGQQPRSLRCPPDQAAPPARVEVGERGAAEPDVAGHGRQLAAERRQERRLAAAGRPGDRRPGPGRAARGRADGSGERRGSSRSRGRAARARSRWAAPCRSRPDRPAPGGRRRRRGRRCPRLPRGTPRPRGAAASTPRGRAAGR